MPPPQSVKEYRDQVYRLRGLPNHHEGGDFVDRRDSFGIVYGSIVPFVLLELFIEKTVDLAPSGVVFPMGYLLFWAFYYTFYKPGFLEERLSDPNKWGFGAIVSTIFGLVIWFVKVTVVELSRILIFQWFQPKKKPAPQARRRPEQTSSYNTNTGSFNTGNTGSFRSRPQQPSQAAPPPPPPKPQGLPPDVLKTLAILGLGETKDWQVIHKRYRELAKKFHPDLNREITEVGRRFMAIDAAYRRLSTVREKYFTKKTG